MPLVLADRVQETTTSTGTGSVTLAGAVTGYQSFAVIGNGNTTYYTIADQGGANWEVGIGTYSTTGPTLARTTVLSSSNSGSLVPFTAGTKTVFVTYPSSQSVYEDASGNVSPLGTIASGVWQGTTIGVAYGGTGVTSSSGANSVVLRDASQNITVNRINQGLQTITASGGTTVLTVASQFNQALIGTGGHTFRLPDATTLSDTTAFQFNNNATGTLTIVNNASGAVGTVAPGGAAGIALLSNATVAGTWDVHAYIPENVTWGTNSLALGSTVITGGTWQGGTVQPAYGGTGLTTFTGANNALYSTASNTLTAGTLPVAAGGTGVTSSTGTGSVVLSNSPTLVTPALGTPSSATLTNATGLPISTGVSGLGTGVATFLGTPSSANLAAAVTDETGSGSLVFATSPTLVTPALGTPSSATLTNATGLPLSTGVTGTLPIANGGTGQTTASAAFNALNPMTTTGDIIYEASPTTAARLGIGSTGQVLTVSGGIPSWATPSSGAGTITRTDFTATAGQTVFTVAYSVGLIDVYRNGVKLATADFTATNGTSFTLATAANAGDIVQAEVFSSLNLYSTFTTDTFSGNGSQTVFTMSVAPASASATLVVISGVTQDPSTYTVASTTLTFSAAPPSGTNNISVRYLGVPAVGVVSSFSGGTTGLTPATATTGSVSLAGILNVANGGTGQSSFTAGRVLYGSFSSSSSLFFDGTNLGIGTSSPSAKLQVVGNVMAGNGTAATPAYHFVGSSAIGMFTPDAGFSVAFSTSSTERMRIDSSGNVGIGKAPSTGRNLEIYTATAPVNMVLQNSSTGTGGTDGFLLEMGATDALIVNYEAGAMRFFTSATERARIDSSGSMGINYTNPSAVLGSTAGGLILQDGGRAGTTTQVAFLNSSGAITWGMTAGGSFTQNSLPAFACRAWVNFNGTGTVAIRASGNVSSITDNGTGAYAVNFTTAMPDANYGANISVSGNPGVSDSNFCNTDMNGGSRANPTTTVFSFTAYRFQAPAIDVEFARVSIFR